MTADGQPARQLATLCYKPSLSGGSTGLSRDLSDGASSSSRPSHIALVEDDAPIRALISRLLRECGYDVTGFQFGHELVNLLSRAEDRPVDLVLLDVMLPDTDGLTLCAHIRRHSNVPIIMVSARGGEADRVNGLDTGADDYIAKPFGRSELLARVRAQLRRAYDSPFRPGGAATRFAFNGWHYFARKRQLFTATGTEIVLTAAEHDLLHTFVRHPQRAIGRERLLELVRSRAATGSDRSIDVLVSRLRTKLGRNSALIRTVRGTGYIFCADVQAE